MPVTTFQEVAEFMWFELQEMGTLHQPSIAAVIQKKFGDKFASLGGRMSPTGSKVLVGNWINPRVRTLFNKLGGERIKWDKMCKSWTLVQSED